MNKNRLVNYLIFGSGSIVSLALSIFAFTKLSKKIDDFKDVENKTKILSNEVAPLENENYKLNQVLNNQEILWYCDGSEPLCKHYYTEQECVYQLDLNTTVHVCYTCSPDPDHLHYVTPFSEIRSDLEEKVAQNEEIIKDKQPLFNIYSNQKEEYLSKMNKYQTLGIIFTPMFLVFVCLFLFSSKEEL